MHRITYYASVCLQKSAGGRAECATFRICPLHPITRAIVMTTHIDISLAIRAYLAVNTQRCLGDAPGSAFSIRQDAVEGDAVGVQYIPSPSTDSRLGVSFFTQPPADGCLDRDGRGKETFPCEHTNVSVRLYAPVDWQVVQGPNGQGG